jgi:hypothetical protein
MWLTSWGQEHALKRRDYLSFTSLALIWIKNTLAILQYCAAILAIIDAQGEYEMRQITLAAVTLATLAFASAASADSNYGLRQNG